MRTGVSPWASRWRALALAPRSCRSSRRCSCRPWDGAGVRRARQSDVPPRFPGRRIVPARVVAAPRINGCRRGNRAHRCAWPAWTGGHSDPDVLATCGCVRDCCGCGWRHHCPYGSAATDPGIAASTATGVLSAAGLALVAGRLLAGYLLDRIFAPYVAVAFFLAPLVGILLLFLGRDLPSRLSRPCSSALGLVRKWT